MSSFLLLSSLALLLSTAVASDRIPKPGDGIKPRAVAATPTLARRQNGGASYPTHILRPFSEYQYTGTDVPTLTISTDIAFTTSGSMVIAVFGPSIDAAIDAAVSTACPQLNSPDCPPSLYKAVEPNEVTLKARGALTIGAFFVIILALIMGYRDKNKQFPTAPSNDKMAMPQSEFDQIVSYTDVAAVIATIAGDPYAVTVGSTGNVVQATTTSAPAANAWSCTHTTDQYNTCTAVAQGPGWCKCNGDGTTYAVTTSGASWGCDWITKPPTTQFPCPTAHSTGEGISWSCEHGSDPQNTCAAVANGPGWCECNNDGTTYKVTSSNGITNCGYSTKPSTTQFYCPTAQVGPIVSGSDSKYLALATDSPLNGAQGAIHIQFNGKGAEAQFQSFVNAHGTCSTSLPAATAPPEAKMRKRDLYERRDLESGLSCAAVDTVGIMNQAIAGGAFAWLFTDMPTQGFKIPPFIPTLQPDYLAALAAVLAIAKLASIAKPMVESATQIVYYMIYQNIVKGLNQDSAHFVIAASDLAGTESAADFGSATRAITASATQTGNCPNGLVGPYCSDCGGESGTSKCSGLSSSQWAGCSCYASTVYPFAPFANAVELASANLVFDKVTQFANLGAMSKAEAAEPHATNTGTASVTAGAGTGTAILGDGVAAQTENDSPAGTATTDTETGIPIPSASAAPSSLYKIQIRNYAMRRLSRAVYQVIKIGNENDSADDWKTYHNVYAPNLAVTLYPEEVIISNTGDMFSQKQFMELQIVPSETGQIVKCDETTRQAANMLCYCDVPGDWHPETDRYLPYRDLTCHVDTSSS